jgi:uncharacterized protein YabE (DUF348 family)
VIPLAKNIKRYFSLKNIKAYFSVKELVMVVLAIVISVSAGVGVFVSLKKEVVIDDNGHQLVVKTMKTTVGEVLAQNGIKVEPYDYISLNPDAKLQKIRKNEIHIKRAVPINVYVDGQQKRFMTYRDNVRDALNGASIVLNSSDRLEGATLDEKIVKDMSFKIVRVKEEVQTEQIAVPFKVLTKENNHLDKGTEKIVKEGKEGVRERSFKVLFEDGKEVARELINDTVVLKPIDRLIEIGTVMNFKTSRGETVRYRKVLNMRATAYTSSYKDTGKNPGDYGFGITYTGMKAKKGVIAVDPKVIPLGSRVFVEVVGRDDYGFAVAGDIGGAIKGDLIDLYFDDQKTVDNWGCKRVKVYLLVD